MSDSKPETTGVDLIRAERHEQLCKHNWDAAHDDSHNEGELAIEAAIWATQNTAEETMRTSMCGSVAYRQSKSRIHQLKVAGALIAAEIDRLLRLEPAQATSDTDEPVQPTGIDLDKLQSIMENGLSLLHDRQTGLVTWHMFLAERLTEIKAEISKAL